LNLFGKLNFVKSGSKRWCAISFCRKNKYYFRWCL